MVEGQATAIDTAYRPSALPLILIAFLLAAAALAQDVQYAVAFESVGGDPVDSDSFASGDVVGLRVDLHNGSDAALQPGAFWVAFPPVESATLFGNAGNGFSFPDRMLDAEGEDVMVEHGGGAGLTQLHEPAEPLAPGEATTMRLQVTVLSSRNSLSEHLSETLLLNAADSTEYDRGVVTAFSPQFVRKMVAVYAGPEEPRTLLGSVGLCPADEADVSGEEREDGAALRRTVSEGAAYELIERLMAHDDGTLPLRYARAIGPDDFGALGLAVKTATTVRGGLERIARYLLLLTDTATYGVQERPGGAAFVLQGRLARRPGIRVANEAALAGVLSVVRQVAAVPVRPASVSFRHPRPASFDEHLRFFGCPVSFDAERDALDFDAGTLDADTRLGDEGLSRFLLGHLDDLRASAEDRSVEARVRDVVVDALASGVPSMADVARRLGMSERTLHRRLARRGGAYRALVERTRRDLAESLLHRHDYPLAEVAFLTGFSEQSAFHRAFKRWTDQTPAAFRHAARSGSRQRQA